MSGETKPKDDRNIEPIAGEDVTITPSQAEGDRETAEEALGEGGKRKGRPDTGHAGQGQVTPTPSQAEGDRESIERSLKEKGLE
jgi:hypothetical protein